MSVGPTSSTNSSGEAQSAGQAPASLLGGRTAWIVLAAGQFAVIVAVVQRSSLSVAATAAFERFGITAATLGAFTMAQLMTFAALQIPVGVLIDRYGSKRLLIVGSLLFAAAQAMFAVVHSVPLAFVARMLLGIGDALTFIAVVRLVPAWFPPQRSGLITIATSQLFQLGFLGSAVGFGAVLAAQGWTRAFLVSASLSIFVGVVLLLLLRDSPAGHRPPVPLRNALTRAFEDVRASWREPGTRLASWQNFLTLFTPMMFGVMWGYPFLTIGQGLAPDVARRLMSLLAISAVVLGPVIGLLIARDPRLRSFVPLTICAATILVWTILLAWPGPAPMWLLVALMMIVPAGAVAGIMNFELARMYNPPSRLGSAFGMVSSGGFASTLMSVIIIGVVLDFLAPAGSTAYSLSAFKWAFATSYLFWAIGLLQVFRYRRRTRAAADEPTPAARSW